MFKVNNKWRLSGVFIVNFEDVNVDYPVNISHITKNLRSSWENFTVKKN